MQEPPSFGRSDVSVQCTAYPSLWRRKKRMGASSNAEMMKRYVEAWEHNDWEAATAIWADNVIHHVPGRGPLAGDFHDKQAFLDHYGQVFAELGGTIEVVEFHDVLSQRGPCRRPSQRAGGAGERNLEFNRV